MNVIHLRTPTGVRSISAAPKVFTPERVENLGALNTALRWLRNGGVLPLAINLLAEHRPTILVERDASAMLIKAAHGFTCRRHAGVSVGCVTLDGCTIFWRFPEGA